MRSIMREIQSTLRGFIKGSRHKLMIISCPPEHSVLLLKSLDAMEDDPASPDIFLAFGHPFDNAESYVEQALASVREQYEKVSEQLAERGDAALVPLAGEFDDSSVLPEIRMSKLVQHIRRVVPTGRQVIWIIYPLEVNEPEQYLQTISHVRAEMMETSLRGTKLIARDTSSHTLIRDLKEHPDVRFYLPSLDPDSLMKKLDKQANDPKLPPEEQAEAHMMLAGRDIAEKRYDQALTRNQEILGYFYHTRQKHHQSVVLNNIGDIHYMQGRYPEAQESYEQGIVIAVEEKSQPLVIYQSINLGNSLLMQNKLDEALVYYQSAEQLAEINRVLPYQVQALEQMGVVKYQSNELEEAAAPWEKAVDLCKRFHYDERLRPNLERLMNLYGELGDSERLNRCKRVLAEAVRNQSN